MRATGYGNDKKVKRNAIIDYHLAYGRRKVVVESLRPFE